MSKGSTQRPGDKSKFDTGHDRIFGGRQENKAPLPCPFCGCELLDENEWIIDDGEVSAYECQRCKAGAPQGAWSKRFKK